MGAAHAKDKERPNQVGRDLSPEVTRPLVEASTSQWSPSSVQVSVMPVGPSSIGIGAPLKFRMASSVDGFGGLYVLSASGRTQAWLENVRLRAGEPVTYPRRGLTIRSTAPAGDETLVFIASRDRLESLSGLGEVTNPLDLQYTHDGLRTAIQQKLSVVKRERWAFTEIKIRVHD